MKDKCFIIHLDKEIPDSRRSRFEDWLENLKNGSENLFDIDKTCNNLTEVTEKIDQSDSLVLICIFVKPKKKISSYDKDEFDGTSIRNQMSKVSNIKRNGPIILYINDTHAKSEHADYYPMTLFTQISNIYLTFNTSQVAFYLQQFPNRDFIKSKILGKTPEQIENTKLPDEESEPEPDPRLKVLLDLNTKANVPTQKETEIEESDIKYNIGGFGQCYIVSGEFENNSKQNLNLNKIIAQNVGLIKKTLGRCRYGLDVTELMRKCTSEELLDKLKKPSIDDADCFVMFFIGRIDEKYFLCSDNIKVEIQTIIDNIDKIGTLTNVPKILIFQNPLQEIAKGEFKNLLKLIPKDDIKLPRDFLLVHSTCYNQGDKQSFDLIEQLCIELKNNFSEQLSSEHKTSAKYDFVKLLEKVCVKNILQRKNSDFDNVYIKSKLEKLVFNAKDVEEEADSLENVPKFVSKNPHFKKMTDRILDNKINYPPVKNAKCLILKFTPPPPSSPASNSTSNSQESNSDSNEIPHKKQKLDINDIDNDNIANAIKKLEETFQKFAIKTIVDDQLKFTDYGSSEVFVKNVLIDIHTAFEENPTDANNDIDCFFLFLFTNNNPKAGTTREKIDAYFDQYKAMFGRPKFIFVQDIQKRSTIPSEIDKLNQVIADKYEVKDKIAIAKYSDTIIFFNNGAPVTQTVNILCEKLQECYTKKHDCNQPTCMHIDAILSSVLKELKSLSNNINFYLPYVNSTLTRRVYFQRVRAEPKFEPIPIVDRGKFVVMNYMEFEPAGRMAARESSIVDKRDLVRTFKDTLKFEEIEAKENLNALETRLFLNKTIEKGDFKKYRCFVLCFLSHGDFNGDLYCKRGLINQNDLINALCKNESLNHKPKIIIIQACQGGLVNQECAIVKPEDEDLEDKPVDPHRSFKYTYKEHSNLLVIRSSYPGHFSYRRALSGSLFIYKLCMKIRKNPDTDLLTICTMVCRDIGYHYKKKDEPYKRQMPHIFHILVDPIVFARETPKLVLLHKDTQTSAPSTEDSTTKHLIQQV